MRQTKYASELITWTTLLSQHSISWITMVSESVKIIDYGDKMRECGSEKEEVIDRTYCRLERIEFLNNWPLCLLLPKNPVLILRAWRVDQ